MANEIIFRRGMNRIKQLHEDDAFLISRTDGTHGYILLSEATQFKGDPLTYADLTPIQITELQRPAIEAAAAADKATGAAITATAATQTAAGTATAAAELASQKAAYAEEQADAAEQAAATIGERIDTGIAALVGSAPDSLDTLQELASALGDDPNFATTVTNKLAQCVKSTDTRLADPRNVINQAGGVLKIWTGSQAAYNALTKANDTLYFIS